MGDITAVIENLSNCSLSRSIRNAPSEVVRANWQTLSFHSKGPLLFYVHGFVLRATFHFRYPTESAASDH